MVQASEILPFSDSDFFASDEQRDEITLKNGAKVWVRQELSAEQQAAFQRVLMTLHLNMETRQMELKDVSWERQQILLAQAYILDWNLPRAYAKSAVEGLRPAVLEEICQGIDQLQSRRNEDAEKKEPATDR